MVWKNEMAVLYCLCEIAPLVTSSCRWLFRMLRSLNDHPDDEAEHEGIAEIIGEMPSEEPALAADQTAERVVEGMREHGHV